MSATRRGVMVKLTNGGGTRWFGVGTYGEAAALTICAPGEIEEFRHMSEQTYVEGRDDRPNG